MKPTEFIEIAKAVAIGWPWQFTDGGGPFFTPDDQSFANLCDLAARVFDQPDFLTAPAIRLDTDHQWDWPIETRSHQHGWVKMHHGGWEPVYVLANGVLNIDDTIDNVTNYDIVATHPLNPTMQPPAGWTPEKYPRKLI